VTVAFLLALASAALLLAGIGDQSLRGDEGAYAAIALESELTGSGPLQRVRDELWINKPPLLFWLQRGAIRAFGPDELSVRLPSVLSGFLLLWLIWARVRAERGPLEGGLAAALLLTTPGLLDGDIAHGLRSGTTDALLMLLVAAAIFAGRDAMARRGARWFGAAASVALSAWTKGLNALLGPFVLAVWSALRPAGARVGSAGRRTLLALVATALVSFLCWLAFAALGGALDPIRRLVWEDLVGRALAASNPRHIRGAFYYPGRLLGDFGLFLLPAAWAAVALWRRDRGGAARNAEDLPRLALAWSVAPVAVLSLASAKLPWYIFPSYAGWALLCAAGTTSLYRTVRGYGRPAGAALLAVLVLAGALRTRSAWSTALSERPPNPLATLERVLDELPESGLIVAPSVRFGPHGIRGTNYFYFLRLRHRHAPSSLSGACAAVLAPAPGQRPESGGSEVRLRRIHRDDADLYVVDACSGRITRALLQAGVAENLPPTDPSLQPAIAPAVHSAQRPLG